MEEASTGASLMDMIVGGGIIVGLLLSVAAVVVKFTKTTKDDTVLAAIRKVVDPILAALRGNKGSPKG